MDKQRIPGFRWAMIIFIFYIISYALPTILKDFQGSLPYKSFVFDLSYIAPFVAVFICLIIFGSKRIQLSGLKFTLGLDTIVRFLLALIIPLVIFIVAMTSFNIFADSFILLQAEDLSVSITTVIIGQLIMAFLIEFAFRSYLQNIVENRVYSLLASIIVGFLYALWNVNLSFGMTYALYSFIYGFAFSIIVGELIRGMRGRTIYIATAFHFIMSFGLVFLFNEELGNVFAMKVIAYSTVAVGLVYLILSMFVRAILYFFTKRNFDEIEENNYMDHLNDEDEVKAESSNNDEATYNKHDIADSSVEETPVTADSAVSEDNTENNSAITEDTVQNEEEDVPVTQNETQPHSSQSENDQNVEFSNDTFNDSKDTQLESTTDAQPEAHHDEHSKLTQNVANDTETTTSSRDSNNNEQSSKDLTDTDELGSSDANNLDTDETTHKQHRTSFLSKLKNRNRR